MQWLNLIASISAALAAFASAFIAWRVYRRQAAAENPFITLDWVGLVDPTKGFAKIRFHITNPGDTHWVFQDAIIKRPRSAALLNERLAPRTGPSHDPGKPRLDLLKPGDLSRSTAFDHTLQASGDRMTGIGALDVIYGDILVFPRSSKSSIKVSIRFNLVSKEADQRRMTIAIKRTLKAASNTVND